LGHTRLLLDGSGNAVNRYAYDAWGNLIEYVETVPNPFTWNGAYGYEWIPLTGLYHVGAREYDPRTARWLQRDPIEASSGDPNFWRYCGNDPVNRADPTGEKITISGNVSDKDKKKIEGHLNQLKNSKSLGDLIKRLEEAEEEILIEHVKNDPESNGLPWQARFYATAGDDDNDKMVSGIVFYDPNTTFWATFGSRTISCSPDVVLAHELGHGYGLSDPLTKEDQERFPGPCVDTFENPYRKEKGLAERPVYKWDKASKHPPKGKKLPDKPKPPKPKKK